MRIPMKRRPKEDTKLDRLRATLGTPGHGVFMRHQSGIWGSILRAEGLIVRWRKTLRGWVAWVERA